MKSVPVTHLIDVANLIEQRQTLEEGLEALATAAARALEVQRCSIMLLVDKDTSDKPRLRVCSHFGNLPLDAYLNPIDTESSIS